MNFFASSAGLYKEVVRGNCDGDGRAGVTQWGFPVELKPCCEELKYCGRHESGISTWVTHCWIYINVTLSNFSLASFLWIRSFFCIEQILQD